MDVHDPRSRIPCQICGMKILRRKMAGHLSACRVSRTFPCGICPKFFASPKGVEVHKGQSHSADERGTIFRCSFVFLLC